MTRLLIIKPLIYLRHPFHHNCLIRYFIITKRLKRSWLSPQQSPSCRQPFASSFLCLQFAISIQADSLELAMLLISFLLAQHAAILFHSKIISKFLQDLVLFDRLLLRCCFYLYKLRRIVSIGLMMDRLWGQGIIHLANYLWLDRIQMTNWWRTGFRLSPVQLYRGMFRLCLRHYHLRVNEHCSN